MATNKNAQMRYQVLDKCFRNNGKRYFIEDLISECDRMLKEINPATKGISRRQIFDDISFMESSEGWSIHLLRNKEGKRVYYQYADSSFSINNMPLNETEISRLLASLRTISQFKGMPQFEWIHELLPKLRQGVISESPALIMEFEGNQDLVGIEHIGVLYNAILYKKVLEIDYLASFETKVRFIIHPYYLKQYNKRWFLFGYNPEENKYNWTLPLDRILTITEIQEQHIPNTKIDWSDYFDDIMGITKYEGIEAEEIVLHFYGRAGHYIETNPIHPYQKHKWINPETLEVRLKLIINFELERLITSYAENVRVIQPISFLEKIKARLENGFQQYK